MDNLIDTKEKVNKYTKLLVCVVFVTNISQIPYFVANSFTRMIGLPVWIIMFLVCLLNGLVKFDKSVLFPVVTSLIFLISILLLSLFINISYLTPSIVYCFYLSIFIFFIGYWSSSKVTFEGLKYIFFAYIISAIFLAVNIYFAKLSRGYDVMSRGYAYGAKNSVSQILFTALVFLVISYQPRNKTTFLLKILSVLFLGLVILLLKSRATILGIVIMILLILMFSKTNKKLKIITLFCILAFIVLIQFNKIYDIIIKGIVLGARDSSDLNSISSGRFDMWLMFPQLILGHELFGIGKFYTESFPLDVWLQYGIFIGSLLIVVSVWPIIWGFKHLSKKDPINLSFLIIASSYWVNGLFEQLAPFGPGVKCYMLWLLLGILLRNSSKKAEVYG